MHTSSSPGIDPGKFVFFILLSVAIHGFIVFFISNYRNVEDTIHEHRFTLRLIETPPTAVVQDNNTSIDNEPSPPTQAETKPPPPKNNSVTSEELNLQQQVIKPESEAVEESAETPPPRTNALELMQSAKEYIQSGSFSDDQKSPQKYHIPLTNVDESEFAAGEILDVYRIPNSARTKIKIKNIFGRIQCFEVPEERDDEIKPWLITHC